MPTDATPPPTSPAPDGARVFTVGEANQMLPYLRSALTDVRAHLREMSALNAEIHRMEAVGKRSSGEWILSADRQAAMIRFVEHQEASERLLREVAERGCQVKDLGVGLCDFPAVIDGAPVLLCWRLDEPSVAHYHGLQDGYRGRRPVPDGTP